LIKSLHLSKGYNASRLLAEFPDKGWMKRIINRLFQKLRETGTVDRRVSSGRPRSARTEENIDLVDDLIVSQKDHPGFISPDLWPPNSPDLNPLDYRIWGLMQERKAHIQDCCPKRQPAKTASHRHLVKSVPRCHRRRNRPVASATTSVREGEGTSFRVPAVANRLF